MQYIYRNQIRHLVYFILMGCYVVHANSNSTEKFEYVRAQRTSILSVLFSNTVLLDIAAKSDVFFSHLFTFY